MCLCQLKVGETKRRAEFVERFCLLSKYGNYIILENSELINRSTVKSEMHFCRTAAEPLSAVRTGGIYVRFYGEHRLDAFFCIAAGRNVRLSPRHLGGDRRCVQ